MVLTTTHCHNYGPPNGVPGFAGEARVLRICGVGIDGTSWNPNGSIFLYKARGLGFQWIDTFQWVLAGIRPGPGWTAVSVGPIDTGGRWTRAIDESEA